MVPVKHVFVTGATSELMQKVLKKIDLSKFTISGLTRNNRPPSIEGISWVFGDINEPNSYSEELSQADIIIHAAAITHSKDPQLYFDVNHTGTKTLINSIPATKNPLFVIISSRVAGEDSGAYGVSKLRAEEEVKKLENWQIIRPSEVFGGSKSEGIDKTIENAIGGGIQLCPEGVESKMYPIHLDDTAKAIYHHTFDEGPKNEIIILNGKVGYSFRELLQLIEATSGNKITILPIPKWFLQLVGFVSKVLHVDIGFVPDQVPRLYSKKTLGSGSEQTVILEDYIRKLVTGNA